MDKLFFGHSVAGLFQKALGERLTPELRNQLRVEGVDLEKPLLPAYPASVFVKCVERVGTALFPGKTLPEVHKEMGKATVRGFAQVEVGIGMFDYLKVITAERSLQRMERNLRAAMNFASTTMKPLGDDTFEIHLNDAVGMPDFFAGLIEGGATAAGRKATVNVGRLEGEGCVLLYRPVA